MIQFYKTIERRREGYHSVLTFTIGRSLANKRSCQCVFFFCIYPLFSLLCCPWQRRNAEILDCSCWFLITTCSSYYHGINVSPPSFLFSIFFFAKLTHTPSLRTLSLTGEIKWNRSLDYLWICLKLPTLHPPTFSGPFNVISKNFRTFLMFNLCHYK